MPDRTGVYSSPRIFMRHHNIYHQRVRLARRGVTGAIAAAQFVSVRRQRSGSICRTFLAFALLRTPVLGFLFTEVRGETVRKAS